MRRKRTEDFLSPSAPSFYQRFTAPSSHLGKQGHWDRTLHSHTALLHSGIQMILTKMTGCNLGKTTVLSRWNKNSSYHLLLQKPEIGSERSSLSFGILFRNIYIVSLQVFDQCFTFLTLRDQLDAQQKHLLWVEEMQLAHWLIFFVWVQEKRTTKPKFVAQGSLRSTFRNNFLQLATFLLRHKLITQCEKRETSTHDLQRNSVAGQVESFLCPHFATLKCFKWFV